MLRTLPVVACILNLAAKSVFHPAVFHLAVILVFAGFGVLSTLLFDSFGEVHHSYSRVLVVFPEVITLSAVGVSVVIPEVHLSERYVGSVLIPEVCLSDIYVGSVLIPEVITLTPYEAPELFLEVFASNPTLTPASRMLTQSWVMSLPLEEAGSPDEQYCEAVVVAFHLSTADPSAPISAVVVAVPEEVALSVPDATSVLAPGYLVGEDEAIEELPVGLLVADPTFLASTIPSDGGLVSFSTVSGCHPKSQELFGMMELTDPFHKGSLIHLDIAASGVRVTTDGYESEGAYHTAAEDVEPSVVVTQLSSLGIKRRRIRGKSTATSLLGLGAPPNVLSELVHAAKAKAPARPPSTTKPKASTAAATGSQGSQQEVLALLQSLNARMTRLEEAQKPPRAPPPGVSAGGGIGAAASTALAVPISAGPVQVPPPGAVQRPLSVLSPHRPSLPPGPSAPCAGASAPFPVPGQECAAGDQAYLSSVQSARRLLGAAPTHLPQVQPGVMEAAGVPSPRERPLEGLLRGGASGAPDQAAVNVALIEALSRIGRPHRADGAEGESFDELLMAGETDLDALKLTGARGAATMARIARSVEKEPEKWIQHLDLQAYRACGSEQTGLPWSMSLCGERHIRFGRLETHERTWHMLASLHSLSRTGQWTLLSAKLGQYLKALEQSVACGGGWSLAWPLTGLAPIRGGGQGLAHHTEYAAGIAYLKDMTALQEAIKKSESPAATGPPATGSTPKYGAGRGGKPPRNAQQQQQQRPEDAGKGS
eukprot:1806783-Amphidinium_carterae.1